ncbi:MAG: tetratricopeptide repeat protein [Candidatus Nitrosocosmicus sp.]|nr:tetratricopeptide repeat protein [Candidatus Nitrosocosmicus sp.]MDN5866132.1 tetratricopeptide repeat protein [Candidatus Nitrosocosmicus sp.]
MELKNMFDGYASVAITGKLLKRIVGAYSYVLSEPSRFEGLLKDIYGSENKKEIFLLTTALKARITEIQECNIVTNDTESKIYKMISKLSSDYGLDEKSAAWVTIAWTIGFDLMTEVEYDNLANGNRTEKYAMLGNYVANMDEWTQQREKSKCTPISNLITVNTTNLKQLYENGMMLHNQGKFAEALECYDKALAIDPQNSNVLSNKGLSLHNQGKFAEALVCYDKALAIDPQDEFIIKRRNNTREILLNSGSNTGSGQVMGQVSNLNNGLKKSINLYFLGIVIAAVFLILGIAAYMIFGTGSNLEENFLGNTSQLISDASMNNIDLINEGSESPSITSHKESISDFTNNIEKELNLQINSENQSLLQSVNESGSSSNSGNSQSNDIEVDSLNGVNQKVDNFKTELGKAMKSNFS